MARKHMMWLLLFVLVTILTVTGCDGQNQTTNSQPPGPVQSEPQTTATTSQETVATGETLAVPVYFSTKDAMWLVAEVRQVAKNEPAKAALEQLIAGPHDRNLLNPVPSTTRIKGITVKDNIATVNFNEAFRKDNPGGSTGELLAVGAVVNTLTSIPHIDKVRFEIEGKPIDTLKGHLDLEEPMGRMTELIKK